MVSREGCTEVSETANPGTDKQEPHKRHVTRDEQAHLCDVRTCLKLREGQKHLDAWHVDVAGIGRKKVLLPGEISPFSFIWARSQPKS